MVLSVHPGMHCRSLGKTSKHAVAASRDLDQNGSLSDQKSMFKYSDAGQSISHDYVQLCIFYVLLQNICKIERPL
jgi:hypothetical protein